MRAVLDSNIFIFALRSENPLFAEILKLAEIQYACTIPNLVLREVVERLKVLEGKEFASFTLYFLQSLNIRIIADELIPAELIQKYQRRGAKEGDALIAAFTEWIKADYLVTENRDFLKEIKLEFKTIPGEEFLQLLLKRSKK